jgi:hypothetical protein
MTTCTRTRLLRHFWVRGCKMVMAMPLHDEVISPSPMGGTNIASMARESLQLVRKRPLHVVAVSVLA